MNIYIFAKPTIKKIENYLHPDREIANCGGGWVDRAVEAVLDAKHSLTYCTVSKNKKDITGETDGVRFFSLRDLKVGSRFALKEYELVKNEFEVRKPDVLCVFGTESAWQTQIIQMLDTLGYGRRTVVWIQGLVSECAKRYVVDVPNKVIYGRTIKELILRNNIRDLRKKYYIQGREEIKAIQSVEHVLTRTDWDRAMCKAINPALIIHRCNETLRDDFYLNDTWTIEKCEKHSIFRSQSVAPLKGLHMLIEAAHIVKREFEDVKIYTTGADYIHNRSFKNWIKLSYYQKYIISLVKKYNLTENIVFLGDLDAAQMKEQYKHAHVYVSCSSIENSPNSLAEAMIMGTPVIASDVGGTTSMLTSKKDGFVYPYNEVQVLAEYICTIFRNDKIAGQFSSSAREHALQTHDVQANNMQLISTFEEIYHYVNER